MIKIGIDPSGTGTTAIVLFENKKLKFKNDYTNKFWINHSNEIINFIKNNYKYDKSILNIENCLPTNVAGSKDKDDLLRLLGSIGKEYYDIVNWISPKHTKSVVKNMENLSKYLKITAIYGKDNLLTYEYGKGWFYNNQKISNHLRDAIIIANYESK